MRLVSVDSGNDPATPDRVDEFVLGDDPAAVPDEKSENVEDLRLKSDRPIRPQQFATICVERVVFEEKEHRRPSPLGDGYSILLTGENRARLKEKSNPSQRLSAYARIVLRLPALRGE